MGNIQSKSKLEAFRERRHLHVFDIALRPYVKVKKFQFLRFINNGDLSSDRNHWNTHRQTVTDTLPIYHIESSNILYRVE